MDVYQPGLIDPAILDKFRLPLIRALDQLLLPRNHLF